MRWAPAVLAVMVSVGISGCTAATTAAPRTMSTRVASATPTAAALTADGTFEQPILCRAVVDYETTQAAIATGELATMHRVAALAATDAAAGLAADRAHGWAPDARSLLQPYLAALAQQVRYYRDVASARSVADAVQLQWPDGTSVSAPLYAAVGISGNLTCPKP